MKHLDHVISHLPRFSTVLLVCKTDEYRLKLIDKLASLGISILGPAYTLSQAMTLASQSRADLAIVERGLSDQALTHKLEQLWGIPSLLL